MSERLLRLEDVSAKTGRRRSTIYRDIQLGTFPAPVKIGASSVWPESELDRWIDERVRASREERVGR